MDKLLVLLAVAFVLLLETDLVQCKGGGRGGGRGSRGRGSSSSSGGSYGGGGGGGEMTPEVTALVVCAAIFGAIMFCIFLFCSCKEQEEEEERRSVRRQSSLDSWRAVELRANAERNERVITSNSTTAATTTTASSTLAPRAVFSTEPLRKVQIPYEISQEEEYALYDNDQNWLRMIKTEGVLAWKRRKRLEYQVDHQGKKNYCRFVASYNHTLGGGQSCNGCRRRLHAQGEWYRCRVCVDIDLCNFCYDRGPTIAEYGHVPGHEATKLQMNQQCDVCKGLIYNTKFKCQSCSNVFFCLGCVKTMKHQITHEGHGSERVPAMSYLMVKDYNTGRSTSPRLPSGGGNPAPSAPPSYRVLQSYPDAPPPAYHECI